MENSYKIENLSFQYSQRKENSLENISFEIEKGEFVLLLGLSGSGKSTLLRHFKTTLSPYGNIVGKIYFEGKSLDEIPENEQASKIGFVGQNPENQIVTDKVWHELAFGLENLGVAPSEIRLRVAEAASFFGIQTWFDKNTHELSGGQKQLLNLASVMAMRPTVLILDEPTAQLDPIAAGEFFEALRKINNELGITIIMCEHRLDDLIHLANRVIVLDNGKILFDEKNIRKIPSMLKEINHPMFYAMPSIARVFSKLQNEPLSPLTVKDGKEWFLDFASRTNLVNVEYEKNENSNSAVLSLRDIYFRYEKNSPDILQNFSLDIFSGELFAILGGNGTGKSTVLSVMFGQNIAYNGKVLLMKKDISALSSSERFYKMFGVLPQNPQNVFLKKTLRDDLFSAMEKYNFSKETQLEKLAHVIEICDLDDLLDCHPYDLSGGEQQRAALAKVLLLEPKILFLDEPTKSLDSNFKIQFANILQKLKQDKVTIVMVSHDIEFCAMYADRCSMLFNGRVVSLGTPKKFFSGNNYYTTSINRIARDVLPLAITENDILHSCKEGLKDKKNDLRNINNTDKNCDDIFDRIDNPSENNPDLEHNFHKRKFFSNSQNSSDDAKKILREENIQDDTGHKDSYDKNASVIQSTCFKKNGDTVSDKNCDDISNRRRKIIGKILKNGDSIISRKKTVENKILKSLLCFVIFILTYLFFGNKFDDYKKYIVHFIMMIEITALFSILFPSEPIHLIDYTQGKNPNRFFAKNTVGAITFLLLVPITIF